MAQQTIGIGLVAEDGTGDPPRTAGTKINDNFTELYAAAKTANAFNGHVATLARQANTGANVKMRDVKLSYGATNFTGQFYSDPVVAFGYNVDAQAGIADVSATDPWGNGIFFESDYAVDSGEGGTATSGTTTTGVTISGKTWGVNRFVNWTVYNVTRGISQQITANTATTLTHAAIAGQTTGDVIRILRRDLEAYIQFNDQVGAYRGVRPWMYTLDKGSLEANPGFKLITAAIASAGDALFTTSVPHNLTVGRYVRFEGIGGGTWGTQLNERSRRIKAVPATNQFTIETDPATFGTFVASGTTVCYLEPDITSTFYGDRANGFQVLAPTTRGNSAPSGQSFSDGLYFRAYSGTFEINGGNSDDSSLLLRCSPLGSTVLKAEHRGASIYGFEVPFVGTASSNVRLDIYGNAGVGVTQSCVFYRNNTFGWGGLIVGNANFPNAIHTIGGIEAGVPNTLPMNRVVQQPSPTAAAHTHQVYASDETTIQHFVDGVGNHVPKVAATTISTTDGFKYIPKIISVTPGVQKPTSTPNQLAGNYANAAPVVILHNTADSRYFLCTYLGGWRAMEFTL